MAFNNLKFYKMDAGYSEGIVANWYKYETTDSRVTVNASGYFPTTLNLGSNDVIYSISDDGPQLIYVLTTDPVTVGDLVDATIDIPADSITTAMLQADSVTAPKLALNSVLTANIVDSDVTKAKLSSDITQFVGIVTHTLTAATTSVVTVTGALTSDQAWAQLDESPSAVDKSIVGVKVTSADTVTLYSDSTFDAVGATVFVVRPAV